MFGLPIETTLLLLGFPLFWICYLIVFMRLSRDWERDAAEDDVS
ncbi:MAG: hypothetical protein R3192_14940 [Woeseiaceae bacterium]|nr:hypothetical protein [Woeseiaceae bacterium]